MLPFSSRVPEAKNLLAPGIRSFGLAQFRRLSHAAAPLDLHQFVNHAEIRRVDRSHKRAANSKSVDLRSLADQRRNLVLVQIPRSKNLHILPASSLQLLTNPPAVSGQIAAVEANAGWLASARDDFLDRAADAVSIHEQCGMFGKHIEEAAKRLRFVFKRHNPRMRLRSISRNPEALPRENV